MALLWTNIGRWLGIRAELKPYIPSFLKRMLKRFEEFRLFLAKLLALFWHCESLVHGKM